MTNHEIRHFLLRAQDLHDRLESFQRLQAELLAAHPRNDTQLAYDVQALTPGALQWQLADVIREARRELEARESVWAAAKARAAAHDPFAHRPKIS